MIPSERSPRTPSNMRVQRTRRLALLGRSLRSLGSPLSALPLDASPERCRRGLRNVLATVTLIAALLPACVSLAPEAKLVKVTKKPADVAGCKILGTVESSPPYVGPKDGMHQMQNKVAGLGGNVLFVTSYNVTGTGMAYRCGVGPPDVKPAPSPAPQP